MRTEGFASSERKEVVEMVALFDEGLKDFCSQTDASVSGHGEFIKISINGVQRSILPQIFLFRGR